MQKNTDKHCSTERIYVEQDFYEKSDALHVELVENLLATAKANAGLTHLMYAYSMNQYQFLTTSAEQIFTRAILDDFIQTISAWSRHRLGVFHVSTPQLRVFIAGCKRELVQDSIKAGWHYVFSLTTEWPRNSWFKVLPSSAGDGSIAVGRVMNSRLAFNELLVHNVEDAYAVDTSITCMNPAQAIILLDGYLW